MSDSAEWDVAFEIHGVAAANSGNDPGAEGAYAADLMKKALSQKFSAAWGDDWNPNPLSDVSE